MKPTPRLLPALLLSLCALPAPAQDADPDEGLRATRAGQAAEAAGKNDEALRHYLTAMQVDGDAGDPRNLTIDGIDIARVLQKLGRHGQAQQVVASSLQAAEQAGDPSLASRLLWLQVGNGQAMADARLVEQACDGLGVIGRGSGDAGIVAESLSCAGDLAYNQGRYRDALASYAAIAPVLAAQPQHPRAAVWRAFALRRSGDAHEALGEYADALTAYDAAAAQFRHDQDRLSLADVLRSTAYIQFRLVQYAQATRTANEALRLARAEDNPSLIAKCLDTLATIANWDGRHAEAEPLHREALRLMSTLGDPYNQAVIEDSLGWDLQKLDRPEEALALHESARAAFARLGQPHGVANSEVNIALALTALGRPDAALTHYQAALPTLEEVGALDTLWWAQAGLMQVYATLKLPRAAVFYGKQAVNTLQQIRRNTAAAGEAAARSVIADKRHVYEELAGLLIDNGRLMEAQQVLGMLKEEEYHGYVRGEETKALDTRAAFSASEANIAERYVASSQHLVALGREIASLRGIPGPERTPQQVGRLTQAQAELEASRAAFARTVAGLRQEFEQLGGERALEFGRKDLDSLRALQGLLKPLGHGAVLVHYLVTPQRLRILLTTPELQLSRDSEVSEAELNRQVFALRAALQNPAVDPRPQAQALYRLLIEPIAADLGEAQAQTLMVAADGVLRYLPLAALHDGKAWLAERYAFASYTPAARGALKDKPQAQWRAAGFGVSGGGQGFSPLPSVPQELEAIVRNQDEPGDTAGVLAGRIFLDARFDRAALSEALAEGYPVVHIASHFHFAPGTDEDSFLLLGGTQRLSLSEFKTGDFPLDQVDLLALSACETAVGGADADGREVEGFGALAQNQGAKSVLATLWPVADASTGLFMQTLYAERENDHLTRAQAVAAAQRAFIHGSVKLSANDTADRGAARRDAPAKAGTEFVVDPAAPLAHPFYWAPFILMGNWL